MFSPLLSTALLDIYLHQCSHLLNSINIITTPLAHCSHFLFTTTPPSLHMDLYWIHSLRIRYQCTLDERLYNQFHELLLIRHEHDHEKSLKLAFRAEGPNSQC